MRLLEGLAAIFIDTFGITRPTDQTRRRVSWFIAGMLALVVLLVSTAAALLYRILRA